MKEVVVG